MLLGRDHERRQIEQALAQARSGASARLALAGEPGIGKTALLGYAAERAAGRSSRRPARRAGGGTRARSRN
jgi:predicted ATPase